MQYQCNMQEEPGDCHQPHNPARTGSEPTENTTGESKVNRPVFPVYHFLVSAAILVFVVIFWRTHHRDHRNWLALRLFVLCSVNRWPLRMVKGTVVGTTDTLREMQRYEQLSSTGLTTGKSSREHRYMIRLLLSLVRVCAGIICQCMTIPYKPHRG